MSAPEERERARPEVLIRSLLRARWILLLLALGVPAGLHALFERQARRLDALGDHGEVTTATVNDRSEQGSVVYAYAVGGATYTWSVAPSEAPGRVGERFAIVYLPEDPSLSRPGADRTKATEEAASNRRFAWKVDLGVFYFFGFILVIGEFRIRRLRRTGLTELDDPRGYRARLILTGVLMLPLFALIFGAHALDASARGESVWPVIGAVVLSLAVIAGTVAFLLRDGVGQVRARSLRLAKWIGPLAIAVAGLRAVAWILGWR